MGFSPRGIGDRRAIPSRFHTDSGNFPMTGLTTSDLSMHFRNASNGQIRVGDGTWSNLLQDGSGLWSASYTPGPTDVATAGVWDMYPVAPDIVTGAPVPFDTQIWEIENRS